MAWFDQHGRAVTAGELRFAEWREAVTLGTPLSLLEEQECAAIRIRRDRARAGLLLAREIGDAHCIRVFSRIADQAEAAWAECGLDDEASDSGERLAAVLGDRADEDERAARLRHFRIFFSFLFHGARKGELGAVLKNLLAITGRVMPDLTWGLSQIERAALVGENKQAMQARERRLVELFQRERGVAGWKGIGATASEEARRNMAEAAKGNKHRATAAARARGEEVPTVEAPKTADGKRRAPVVKRQAAVKLPGLDHAGQFLVVSLTSGEKREAGTLNEALRLWMESGLRESGSALRGICSDEDTDATGPNAGAVMMRRGRGSKAGWVRVASVTGDGELRDLHGRRVARWGAAE